jgi:hypothetical protein
LEVGGEDLAGGVILKADESEFGATVLEPRMTAGIGEPHHAEAWAGQAAGAVLARPTLLGRRQFRGPQEAAHGLPADSEVLFDTKVFRELGIVEALVLAAGCLKINCFWGIETAQGVQRPRLACCTQPTETG